MPFVQAQCPACREMLVVVNSKRTAICQFCGSEFVIEDTIVNTDERNATDFLIEAGILKAYKGKSVDVVIPDYVVKIGESCFEDSNIRSVTIPNGVTEIAAWAFASCKNLTNISIPSSVKTIGSAAFADSGVISIVIPHGVLDIKSCTFKNCKELASVSIPDSVTNIASSAFKNCKNLKNISIPNSVTSIGSWDAFSGSGLTSITIPKGVTLIPEHTFQNCKKLKSVSIPNSLTSIESAAFKGCDSLTNISIPKSVTKIATYRLHEGHPLPSAFHNCSNLSYVTFEDKSKEAEFIDAFKDTPYFHNYQKKLLEKQQKEKAKRRERGLCQYCGGRFEGLFKKKCVKCGKPKDY